MGRLTKQSREKRVLTIKAGGPVTSGYESHVLWSIFPQNMQISCNMEFNIATLTGFCVLHRWKRSNLRCLKQSCRCKDLGWIQIEMETNGLCNDCKWDACCRLSRNIDCLHQDLIWQSEWSYITNLFLCNCLHSFVAFDVSEIGWLCWYNSIILAAISHDQSFIKIFLMSIP